ncbi:MAG: L,D-transpeptidase family protein [Alphaproteobacteria bacterium]|nr:L,D-transpeptidase family protein [Alphaproteobacteria bacterium]
MGLLRKISAAYMAMASVYTVAILLDRHPETAAALKAGAQYAAVTLRDDVAVPAFEFTSKQVAVAVAVIGDTVNPPVQVAKAPEKAAPAKRIEPEKKIARGEGKKQTPALRPSIGETPAPVMEAKRAEPQKPVVAERTEKPKEQPAEKQVAEAAKPKAPLTLAPEQPAEPSFVDTKPPSQAEIARVSQRLRDSLTPELLAHFELFLYVSKASRGPLAQRMYVYAKQPDDGLKMLYNWPASTGREKVEYNSAGRKLPSFTPQGYYELDPDRMFRRYRSVQWNQPMPFAMFFNWINEGNETGLAIHAAHGDDIGLLGTRASAGCVRLAPENAALLFDLVKKQYKGLMPKFAYDRRTATMSNTGMLVHNSDGRVQLTQGYKVLVFIEDFGGEDVVAALF